MADDRNGNGSGNESRTAQIADSVATKLIARTFIIVGLPISAFFGAQAWSALVNMNHTINKTANGQMLMEDKIETIQQRLGYQANLLNEHSAAIQELKATKVDKR